MKIGIFDSGLGGLIVTHGLVSHLPMYDYIYLGDTARVPYGNRSQETIYEFTRSAVEYLFGQDCALVIIACNTASADALRKIQNDYLPLHYPDRKVLGVLIPAAEAAAAQTRNNTVGVIATQGTVDSGAYVREIEKLDPRISVFQQATPLLVPLIENNAIRYAGPMLDDYLQPLLESHIDTLVLACTHYPILKDMIQARIGKNITIIAQNELIPTKLAAYLKRHSEFDQRLTRNSTHQFLVTDLAQSTIEVADQLFGRYLELRKIIL